MSLFDSASLIVTPNAYKAGKLYSLKPTDGAGDLSVTRATSATRINSNGLIENVASGVPRIDYTNGSCPSILVEPQRTNLLTYSEQFDNASWAKSSGVTVTANDGISPDGTMNADRIIFTGVNQFVSQFNTLSAVAHYGSVYVKGTLGQTIRFTVGGTEATRTLTGEWQRIELLRATAPSNGNFTISTYSNVTARDILVWGAQLEAGANATSYIPTTSSTVTRNADVISKTGISDLIGQTEGTIYMDVNVDNINNSAGRLLYTIYNNSTNARISSGIGTNNKIDLLVTGPPNAQIFSQTISTGKLKLAVSYKNSNIFLTVNGILATPITILNVPASMNSLSLGATFNGILQLGEGIDLFAHWKTALTEQECIELTTI